MKKINYLFLSVIVLLVSCKATVESETNRWQDSIILNQRLQTDYPNLKSFFEDDFKKAQEMKDKADVESSEEVKIKTLQAANSIMKSKLARDVQKFENLNKNIADNIKTIENKYPNDRYTPKVGLIFNEAMQVKSQTDLFKRMSYSTRNEAEMAIQNNNGMLANINNQFRNFIKEKQEAERKAKEEQNKQNTTPENNNTNTNTTETTQPQQDAPTMKTCSYCKGQNASSATKCSSCGAPF